MVDKNRRKQIMKGVAGIIGGLAGITLLKGAAADWIVRVAGKEHRFGANLDIDGNVSALIGKFNKVEIADANTHLTKDGPNNLVFTDAVSGARTLAELVGYVGEIIMWNGLLANIPSGWEICDGADGKPDLRHKFVRGAGAGQEAGDTGGSDTHLHAVSGNTVSADITHLHSFSAISGATSTTKLMACTSDTGLTGLVPTHDHTHCVAGNTGNCNPSHLHGVSFNSGSCSTLPTFYELIFIIRV